MKKNKNTKDENIDEINPYQVDKFSKIPSGFVLTFFKFWAAAAAVFFILIGGIDLGLDFSKPVADGYWEMTRTIVAIILVSLFLSILLNYVVKHFAYLMLNRRNNTMKWMVIKQKGFLGFLMYFVYTICIIFLEFFIVSFLSMYHLIPALLDSKGQGIEPFSFGFIFIVLDGCAVFLKNSIVRIAKRIQYKRLIEA